AQLVKSFASNLQFLGASTSHYQIEGNYKEVVDKSGQAADTVERYNQEHFIHRPGKSVDFWNNYKTIIPKIKEELNINMLRISIGWSRVQPYADVADFEQRINDDGVLMGLKPGPDFLLPEECPFDEEAILRYVDIVKTLKENGIEPLVTFHHYTNPIWFQELGG